MRTLRSPTERGFTLIELLVVLTLIALLLAIAAPRLQTRPAGLARQQLVTQLKAALATARATAQRGQAQRVDLAAIDPGLTSDRPVLFFPDGSSSGATIRRADQSLLQIDWLTGAIRDAH